MRWIADVARLVSCRPIDWAVVEDEAARRHLSGLIGRGLDFVRRHYDVDVPDATVRALRRASGVTRGYADLWSRSPKRTRAAGAVNLAVVHYVLASQGWPRRDRVGRYPEYLRVRMALGTQGPARRPARWHG